MFTILGGFYLGVEVFLNKKEHQKKRALKLKTEASLYTLYKSFENSIYTLYSYFCKDIIKWCKVYTKTDTWFQKSHAEFQQPQTNSKKSKKLKFDGPLLSREYISSSKTYTDDSSNITFNDLRENSSNSLCNFWNHKPFFTTQLLCILLAQRLHTFYKSSPYQSVNLQTFHCSR